MYDENLLVLHGAIPCMWSVDGCQGVKIDGCCLRTELLHQSVVAGIEPGEEVHVGAVAGEDTAEFVKGIECGGKDACVNCDASSI